MNATLGTTPPRPAIVTCSRDVADRLGKRHSNVLRAIRTLQCDEGFASANFILTSYAEVQNGQIYPEYLITRDGLIFLVSSFNGAQAAAWKLEMIEGGEPLAADDVAPEAQQAAAPVVQQVDPAELVSEEMRTTSRQIAERFGKDHSDVLKKIRNLHCSDGFRRGNFAAAEYIDAQGKPRDEYQITRDGFSFLAMGFTGKRAAAWKEQFIGAFNSMEERLRQPSMTQADVSMAVAHPRSPHE